MNFEIKRTHVFKEQNICHMFLSHALNIERVFDSKFR
jgi:hypothetical protein